MRPGPRIATLLLAGAATAIAGCKRREGDVPCSAGALQLAKPATLVAQPQDTVWDVRVTGALSSSFAVVWSAGPSEEDNDLYARRVRLDGTTVSNEVRVTLAAGISAPLRLARGPAGIGLSWRDGRLARDVAMATVLDAATLSPVAPPAVFQSPVIADDQAPVPAIAAVGSAFAVVWNGRGTDGNDHLYGQLLAPEGVAVGEPFALVPDQTDRATPPSAAAAGTAGGIVIADQETRVGVEDPDVFLYFVSGTSAAAARYGAVSDARAPEAVGLSTPGVVWIDLRDGGRPDLWFASLDSGERRLTQGPEQHLAHSVAAANGFFLTQWTAREDGRDEIRVRAHQADGRPAGGVLLVGEGAFGDVAWNGAAGAVVWTDEDRRVWFRPVACSDGGEP